MAVYSKISVTRLHEADLIFTELVMALSFNLSYGFSFLLDMNNTLLKKS